MADQLARWLTWLGTPDCRCAYAWRGLGTLYGISMGDGWVRQNTAPGCPHHDDGGGQ